MKQFNVILMDFNSKSIVPYDVLPYFRRNWKKDHQNILSPSSREELKQWIIDNAKYQFWARCEYEIMIGPWPYRKDHIIEELHKVDAFEQIMFNIDVITDILTKEFLG